jgi:DNA-binding IclR family transcriptional regulator
MTETLRAYSTANTMRALELLAVGPMSVPEVAARLQIGDRSARRLVKRLAADGYVERVPGDRWRRRYRLSLAARQLGRRMACAPGTPAARA